MSAINDAGFLQQVRRNSVALISLTIAVIGLSYNTWRNEQTEFNQNMREAGFETLLTLGEVQQVIFELHYGTNKSPDMRALFARDGWSKVLLIKDLSMLMPDSVRATATTLRDTWQSSWESLGDSNEGTVGPLDAAIENHRKSVLATLVSLR